MGFGILFFAVFLTYFGALTPISSFTYVLGSALMLFALYKLSVQNKLFVASAITSAALLLVSLTSVGMYVFGSVANIFYGVLIQLEGVLAPSLLILILVGIYLLAKEVELRKLQGWSIVNTVFIAAYLICDIISIFVKGELVTPRLGIVCLILQILYSAFMLVILFNCYARICYEDDKNMEKGTSGVPVFDALNKAFNKVANKNKKDKGDK